MKQKKLELRPSLKDDRDYQIKRKLLRSSTPYIHDNTSLFSEIKNQGDEGACVGFAIVAWQEGLEGVFIDLSERMAYENAKIYDSIKGEKYSGTSIKGGLKGSNKEGICREEYWPYKSGEKKRWPPYDKWTKDDALISAGYHKIKQYVNLIRSNEKFNIKDVFEQVEKSNGLVAGIYVYDEFDALNKNNPILNKISGSKRGSHAIAIVGYDKGKKTIKIRNSWGNKWGENGYGYISFSVFIKITHDLWAFSKDGDIEIKGITNFWTDKTKKILIPIIGMIFSIASFLLFLFFT